MKIIAGKYKGRNLLSPSSDGIRPTASRMRAAIFNILASMGVVQGAKVIDLCCGTGALGIEALSRGAEKVVFIDGSSQHLKLAWANICQLNEQENAIMIRSGAEDLPKAREEFDLVFIDPPYFKGIANKALISLIEKEWLAVGAIIILELPKQEDLIFAPEFYQEISTRIYGNIKFILLEKI